MDVATVGVLGGMITLTTTIMLTVMIYLDRARRADMAAGFAAIDKRFDRVDRRFDRVDRRFDRVDKRFDRVDKRFERVDKRFDQIDRRFGQIDRRFDQIDRRFGQSDERFDGFTSIVVDLAKDVGEVKGRLGVSAPIEAFSTID